MSETQGLPRPTQAGWAVYRTPDGWETWVPKYVPSPATNMKAVQDDDVPAGAVFVRDEPLDQPAQAGDVAAALRNAAAIAAAAELEAVRNLAAPLEAAADALGGQ